MSVERHLYRAAHGLRELTVETPEFVAGPSTARRVGPGALAALLLIGGTYTVMTQPPGAGTAETAVVESGTVASANTGRDTDTAAPETAGDRISGGVSGAAAASGGSTARRPLSDLQELAIIRSIADDAETPGDSSGGPVGLAFDIPDGAS